MKKRPNKLLIYDVQHPKYGVVRVEAETEDAAIVAAAAAWGVRWQEYGFYAWCEVTRA